ncbi:hypothetical protein [Hoylesella oralis]|uniref:tetratricopeptide repeat protein n=1 Tax=Hoylesella oralis TaxID=28134 RepID=UPI0028E322F0|nr:hypothetical protein [Hoylesella oralis]
MIKGRQYILLFLFFFTLNTIYGQKKEIAQARQFIKNGNNLENAESMMTKLLQDSTNKNNTKIWNILFNAVKKQYELGNEKLYLKQQYDTAQLFIITRRMFNILESYDSVEAIPDRLGNIKIKNRDKHADFLNQYRANLYNGGNFFIKKQNFKEAYAMFNDYIDCTRQPLFTKYNYLQNDKILPEAAYWTVYCGYKMKDAKATLLYADIAAKDTAHYMYMLQYLSETYKAENDTSRYVDYLNEGFNKYPTSPFFFPRLIDYYSHEKDYAAAMKIVNVALQMDSANVVYRFAKASVLLNTGDYAECIKICDKIILENDTLADAFLFAGLAYFNQAAELERNIQISRGDRQRIIKCYQKAYPYLERYRELAPDQEKKWGMPLYKIYYNLNMGKKFDEIDKIIRGENNANK